MIVAHRLEFPVAVLVPFESTFNVLFGMFSTDAPVATLKQRLSSTVMVCNQMSSIPLLTHSVDEPR